MTIDQPTTRQRILDLLDERPPIRPTAISDALSDHGITLGPDDIVAEIAEIGKGTSPDHRILVRPPECRDCGFEGFDRPANIPSRCPDCRSEWIEEPLFTLADGDGP